MRFQKITAIRKKTENRIENIRFMRAVQQAKNRQTLKTEHATLHNLIYQQISPGLRDRVLQRGRHIDKLLSNNS